jgi:serine phosphatase RsbU (regulator of sigma subunit)/methyl-accepting chemotaxis protein
MKLRYQLMLAFFFLAVLPLSAVTVYSYQASTQAFRKAVEEESGRMAEQMEDRMNVLTADLDRRIGGLDEIRIPATPTHDEDDQRPIAEQILEALGDAAEYVDKVEIVPLAPEAAKAVGQVAPVPQTPAVPGTPSVPSTKVSWAPVVIDMPRLLEKIGEEAKRSAARRDKQGLSKEEAEQLAQEMNKLGAEFGREMARMGAEAARAQKGLADQVKHQIEVNRRQMKVHVVREFSTDVRTGERTIGRLKAQVNSDRLLDAVLSRAYVDEGEIPFALDDTGNLYTPSEEDRAKLEAMGLSAPRDGERGFMPDEDWIVVTRQDPGTGLMFGLARPVGESLGAIRRTAARNLSCGLGVALLALAGILPVSRRMTRNLTDVSRGATALAAGNLDTHVPVRSRDEFGQLARTFNDMSSRLKENQQKLVEQERLKKELEMCRRIQNELLPRGPMRSAVAEIQGVSLPARELGGDFFNYFELPSGQIAVLMGDVSGKGVPAALFMANLQATLRARLPIETDLAAFADAFDREIESSTDDQLYVTLFLSVLDPERGELRYVNAGHQSPYVVRADGTLERLDPTGRPVGLFAGRGYEERRLPLRAGDSLFLYTDGLVDAESPAGDAFGTARLAAVLSRGAGEGTEPLLARMERALRSHRDGKDAPDDAAMLVLRVGDSVGRHGAA